MKQLALDIVQPVLPSFDNFVPGRNAEALAHVRAALASAAASKSERFIYLWGAPGSGRTHLLKAAAMRAGGRYVACPASDFDDDACVLAVDDVEALDEAAQVALFHRYNRLREQGGALLASGATPPTQLKLRADLLTRLAWGLVLELHALSDDEKLHALKQHAHARGFKLPDEVAAYLLTHAPREMGALFAMLDALDKASLANKRAITVPLLRDVLSQKIV